MNRSYTQHTPIYTHICEVVVAQTMYIRQGRQAGNNILRTSSYIKCSHSGWRKLFIPEGECEMKKRQQTKTKKKKNSWIKYRKEQEQWQCMSFLSLSQTLAQARTHSHEQLIYCNIFRMCLSVVVWMLTIFHHLHTSSHDSSPNRSPENLIYFTWQMHLLSLSVGITYHPLHSVMCAEHSNRIELCRI